MTAILVLLFIIGAIGIDALNQRRTKIVNALKNLPADIMLNDENVGFTMADGGKKTEEKK